MTAVAERPVEDGVVLVTPDAPTKHVLRHTLIWLGRLVVVVVILGLWQWGVNSGVLSRLSFSTPRDVALELRTELTSGDTLTNVWVTTKEALIGFAIGAGIAMLLVGLITMWHTLGEAIAPVLGVMNSVPREVLAPLFIVWFGIGLLPKVVLVSTVVFFVVFFNLYGGISTIDPVLESNLRVLGASPPRITTTLYVPALFGWLMAGLRTSVGFAFAAAVVSEYLGATEGLGHVIFFGLARYQPQEAIAGIIVLALVVLLLTGVLGLVRIPFRHWEVGRL